ncbi:MAG: CdaR family protein [Bryobacteraceae bacterium]|nr:CdaR family protein [Bryobacteraceae bacterium]MDW8377380.1 CdaR family protein [Bryobacterales bacterium]
MTGWFTENLGLKLLSLAVALLLWLALVGEPNTTSAIVVPVQYHNLPKDLEISSEFVHSAYVEVRGTRARLATLGNAVVVIDLAGQTQPGERTFPILGSNVNLPPGVEFLRAIPSQIRLRLEPRIMREVPVMVRYGPSIPQGLQIARQQVDPDAVRIVGPASNVQRIDHVQTDPVEFLHATEGEHTVRVHAYAGDPRVRLERSDLLITVKVVLNKDR